MEWSDRAESIWRRTVPLRGTVGQAYLEHRGCMLPPVDSDLRYLAPTDRHPPSLCAKVSDVRTNRPLTLHFTAMKPDGSRRADRHLLAGHRKRGGCIRLWPDEAVTHGLALAEGIETALAAAHVHMPIWSTIDCGNLAQLPVLAGVEVLTIYADNDQAGIKAARTCARRWADAGREVYVVIPTTYGVDVNDVVRA